MKSPCENTHDEALFYFIKRLCKHCAAQPPAGCGQGEIALVIRVRDIYMYVSLHKTRLRTRLNERYTIECTLEISRLISRYALLLFGNFKHSIPA